MRASLGFCAGYEAQTTLFHGEFSTVLHSQARNWHGPGEQSLE